jgi:hypothetical protein
MGTRSRYDRDRPVGGQEAAEAAEMHQLAELLAHRHAAIGMSRSVASQVGQVLHMTAKRCTCPDSRPPQGRGSRRPTALPAQRTPAPRSSTSAPARVGALTVPR